MGQTPTEVAEFVEREYLRRFAIGPWNSFVADLIVPSEVDAHLKILRGSSVLVIKDVIKQSGESINGDKDEKETQK